MALKVDTLEGLVEVGRRFVGGKQWQAALLLEVGTELAVAVNKGAGLSGEQKSQLVCQTILHLLDDAEKAEKIAQAESTVTETTIVPKELKVDWVALRNLVSTVLPVTLRLIVGAARGKFELTSSDAANALDVGRACVPFFLGWCAKASPPAVEAPKAPSPVPLGSGVKTPVPLGSGVKTPSALGVKTPGKEGLVLRLANQTQPTERQPPKVQVIQEAVPTTPPQ